MRMCLWVLTACFGVVVAPQPQYYGPQYYPSIVAGGPAPPILLPTVAPPVNTIPTGAPPTLAPTLTPTGQVPFPTGPPPTATPVTPTNPTLPPGTQQPFPLIDPRMQTAPTRETESLVRFGGVDYQDVIIEVDMAVGSIGFPRNRRQTGCGCYQAAQCGSNTDGTGLIDFRIVNPGTVTPPQQCAVGQRFCCLPTNSGQLSCGSRVTGLTSYPIQAGQAKYGDYPWMTNIQSEAVTYNISDEMLVHVAKSHQAVIMSTGDQYVGGGVLIDLQTVLTTAHRITSYGNGNGLKIRLGEWDGGATYEQYPFRDFPIARLTIHESFNPNTLQNDVALIRIVGGVPAGTPAIVPICLPTAGQNFEGQRCWVSGWGKNSFGVSGAYQSILKAVDVPVIASATCETTLRTTRLGSAYLLDRSSFLCAGGELNKDACTGDGGSGLVCETTPGRWVLSGLVAWGLGCATQGVPAAYVNVATYLPWITSRQNS